MSELQSLIKEIPGFKIPNTHFKIGSKIHISDFYYAKRFFQNGFFASRVAFQLTIQIAEEIVQNEKLLKSIKNKGLTIVGYEMYSELLISFIEKFLKKKLGLTDKLVNHNLYEDGLKLKLCKKNNLRKNIIIVVPIASTFSTAIKIEGKIKFDYGVNSLGDIPYIIYPLNNVLYISDGPVNPYLTELEKSFGWIEKVVSEKLIKIQAHYLENNESIAQKFLLSLETKWHDSESCTLCYPIEDGNQEITLYETDKTNVTPAIVFGFPQGRIISKESLARHYYLDKSLFYGHHKRNNEHFLYSINTEIFLEQNELEVRDWLFEVKNSALFQNVYAESDKVILISPSHFSNTLFINLVNELLFLGSANILHYDSENDFIQNFNLVYGKELREASKIFFVDDSLKSGRSFNKIFQFVESSLNAIENTNYRSINGCIFLKNKSQPHVDFGIRNKLEKNNLFLSFIDIHFHNTLNPFGVPPILLEKQRYDNLTNQSNIDSIKIHFAEKANRISAEDYLNLYEKDPVKRNRRRSLVIAIHRIVQYFTIIEKIELSDFFDLVNQISSIVHNPIEGYNIETDVKDVNSDFVKSYLKALTQLPFVQYKPLKDKVFKWVQAILINEIDLVSKDISKDNFDIHKFENLKFLIRRSCLINSNFLISLEFMRFLKKLYSNNGIPDLITNANVIGGAFNLEDKEISKLRTFYVYYLVQVKELIGKNEYRSLTLTKNLKSLENNNNPHINQIARIINEENTILISGLLVYLKHSNGWKSLYSDSLEIIYSNDAIIKFLNKSSIKNHQKYGALNSFFKISGQPKINNNKSLLNYLWLEYFFQFDFKKEATLSQKTELIFAKIFGIFEECGLKKCGAFFAVLDNKVASMKDILDKEKKHLKKTPFIAFNQSNHVLNGIDTDEIFNLNENKYLIDFLFGNAGGIIRKKTIIELEKTPKGWIDLYSTENSKDVILLQKDLLDSSYNRLFLMQVSRKDENNKLNRKPQGLIGFYYNQKDDLLNRNLVKYLLLLRNSLSEFISNHHENDEFRDWQLANLKQKTSLLTGHGRHMLMKIVEYNRVDYSRIIETLLWVQRFVIDKQEERRITTRKSQVLDIFKSHFKSKIIGDEDASIINEKYLKSLQVMVVDIFGLEQIENKVLLNNEDVFINSKNNHSFPFDKDILNMICFELFVNAKKNRWIFLNDEGYFSSENIEYKNNKIWIESEYVNNEFILKISNTGPIRNLNVTNLNKNTIKQSESSSGIELIRTLLNEFDLGTINFLTPRCIDKDFGKISVEIILYNNFS